MKNLWAICHRFRTLHHGVKDNTVIVVWRHLPQHPEMFFRIIATPTTGNYHPLRLGEVTDNAPRGQSLFVSHTSSLQVVPATQPKRGTALVIGCRIDIM